MRAIKNKPKKQLSEKRFRLLSVPLLTRLQPHLRRSDEQQVAESAAMNLFFFTQVKIIWFSGWSKNFDRYYGPPCSKQTARWNTRIRPDKQLFLKSKKLIFDTSKKSWTFGLRDPNGSILWPALFETNGPFLGDRRIRQMFFKNFFSKKRLTQSTCLISCPPLQRKSRWNHRPESWSIFVLWNQNNS